MKFDAETTGIDVVKHFDSQVRGKIVLITGPTAGGIGAETAISLAHAAPALIVLLGRSREKAQPVLDAVRAVDAAVPTKFVELDLCSLASVRAAAAAILADPAVPRIDALINNAAVMACPFGLSADGIELQFASGHVGHFLLTNLLAPKLQQQQAGTGTGARIVNVSSTGHKLGHVRFDDPNFSEEGSYTPWGGYGQAKTANVLFSVALNARLAEKWGVRSYALHPGSIMTNLGRHTKPSMYDEIKVKILGSEDATWKMKNFQQGCSTQLRAALDPSLPGQEGVMLYDCALTTDPQQIFPRAVDPADAERLWTLSEKLVGQEFKY
ncbi:hypothetical protein RB595_006609 [Gaeumannomyces hyphopodioides]